MSKRFLHSSYLALAIVAACTSDDPDPTPAETSTVGAITPSGGAAGTSATASPEPTAPNPAPPQGPDESGVDAGADVALQPALPVTENPDHDQLLSSQDPALAANKRLVYDLWRTLIEARDTALAEQYLAEGYIQHNPNADTGRAGVFEFFASLGEPLPVQERVQAGLVAIVAEGDYVAVARVDAYEEPRPYTTTWFDLFRIEDGLVAEHWDHGRLPAGGTPSAYVPPTVNPDQDAALLSADPQLAANKQLVHEMWRTLLDAQQVEEAPRYLAEGYIQHNPLANTGLQGFLTFFRQFAQPAPVQAEVANFIQIVAEGDLVVLATLRSYDDANGEPYTTTWFDMFRVSDGLLVEHWDTATLE